MNEFVHYATISTIVVLPTIGVGIGQGLVNKMALKSIDEQPAADNALNRAAILSMTLSETAVLLPVIIGLLLIMDKTVAPYAWLGYIGIFFAVALPGFAVGLASSLPGRAALNATARQPFFAPKILQLLLITQTIIQTPTIFGFIIALFIRSQLPLATTLTHGLRLFASGLAFGLGCLGPLYGLSRFTRNALQSVGINRDIFPQLRTFTFVSQALIEAPIIFALLISIILSVAKVSDNSSSTWAIFIAAALCVGLSTIGAGINSGRVAATAVDEMGKHPELYPILSRVSIIAQTFIDTTVIYGALLAFFLILSR